MCIKPVGTIDHSTYKCGLICGDTKFNDFGWYNEWPGFDLPVLRYTNHSLQILQLSKTSQRKPFTLYKIWYLGTTASRAHVCQIFTFKNPITVLTAYNVTRLICHPAGFFFPFRIS